VEAQAFKYAEHLSILKFVFDFKRLCSVPPGRPQDVHGPGVLRRERRHRSHRAEHARRRRRVGMSRRRRQEAGASTLYSVLPSASSSSSSLAATLTPILVFVSGIAKLSYSYSKNLVSDTDADAMTGHTYTHTARCGVVRLHIRRYQDRHALRRRACPSRRAYPP
jgi:hypothetical protein